MTTWRYKAVPAAGTGLLRGEHSGESAAEVRAALNRAGLRVLDVRPVRRSGGRGRADGPVAVLSRVAQRHLRARRAPRKAEFFDALATMLEAGIPLVEAVGSVTASANRASGTTLARLREDLRSGESLAEAMGSLPAWFDRAEAAMVRAGQRSGELPGVLRTLAERHTRAGELTGRLAAALAYPAVVAAVGLGVVVFLSVKTLPELAGVLLEAGQELPALTSAIMATGRFLVAATPWLTIVVVGSGVAALAWLALASRFALPGLRWPEQLVPRVARRSAVAETLLALAELLRAGVPAVDALRILAPTAGGFLARPLSRTLERGADHVERGGSFADLFADRRWFPDEVERLIRAGEQTGELETILERVGFREQRSARRLVDRLAALLEPAVILALAVGVGVVVMAAVLPLVRLQEML